MLAYPACNTHKAAMRPVTAPLAPKEAVHRLFERTRKEREANEAKAPQQR